MPSRRGCCNNRGAEAPVYRLDSPLVQCAGGVTHAKARRRRNPHGRARDPPVRRSPGIREQGFVRIGGIEQWITIHGSDRANPVVLFLHGGPGNAMSAFADSMFHGWQKDFTLVQWDQRGAGRTFARSGPSIASTLSIDRMAKDGIEVAEYLTKYLNQRRIILVGGSWGSLLGIHIVKRKPALFHAYVGTGQLVNMRENFRVSYQRVLEHARESGNKSATDELSGVGAPPWDTVAEWRTFRKWRNEYQRKLAASEPLKLVRAPEYTSAEDLANEEAADDLSFAHFNFVGDEHDRAVDGCGSPQAWRGFHHACVCDPGCRGSQRRA